MSGAPEIANLPNNKKIDFRVVVQVESLLSKLPESARPKRGADYRLTPALGGRFPRYATSDPEERAD